MVRYGYGDLILEILGLNYMYIFDSSPVMTATIHIILLPDSEYEFNNRTRRLLFFWLNVNIIIGPSSFNYIKINIK